MPKVFITGEIENIGVDLLKHHGFEVKTNDQHNLPHSQIIEIFSRFDAVITLVSDKIDEEVIRAASPDFKVISNYATGFDNIDVLAAKRRGIVVTSTPGVSAAAVAEHTFMLIMACVKRVIEADRFVRLGKYCRWDPNLFVSPQIWGKTIGIVGLGHIGSYVASIAFGGFKMKVLYHDINSSPDFEMLTEAQQASLERLLKDSDVVSMNLPLTDKTRHMIGREELKLMKDTAILVNTGRGATIDEEALIWALKEKVIRGAGLDVFEDEFHIPHELTTLGNVVLTPHIASATIEARDAMSKLAARNVIDVFEGKEPEGIVKAE